MTEINCYIVITARNVYTLPAAVTWTETELKRIAIDGDRVLRVLKYSNSVQQLTQCDGDDLAWEWSDVNVY